MKKQGKVIGVLNSKGGVGKSTLALHMAMCLYHNKALNPNKDINKVVVLDTDRPQYSLHSLREIELNFLKENISSPFNKKLNTIYSPEFLPLIINSMEIKNMVKHINTIKSQYEYTIVDVVGSLSNDGFNEDLLKCFDYVIVPMNAEFEPSRSTVEFVENIIIPMSNKYGFKYDIVLNNIHHTKENYIKGLVNILKKNGFNFLDSLINKKDKYIKYLFEDSKGMYSSLIYKYDTSISNLLEEIINRNK